ncbi:protein FAR-RED IMPAIRED RESPONSE 1-like [Beta vulgaris subsp. vulgaris]|uniref:protein FAR-RED IMPAIRED RESPONSE 1-like n=1 Tax=Beta vulgaris subsp. vulgaris TaxID=3555 RepID=UPI002036DBF4|nr:protein FAR-RED IMPAIRED RESPONSE 1-like [Beta vulgaris subsp. vulgaris]
MTEDNQNFFHMHRLDEFGYLKDVLWVDARSRAAYEEFGDVVCFDATYLTNDYDLPFANFVGVNHHGQTILLGCALVSHETTETYEWVFRTWLMCMNGKAPSGFLTDQDAAMRRALANCMPDTWHRWCLWHILTKFSSKLGMYTKYQDIKVALHNAIYDSMNDDEFEKSWGDAIAKFDLGSDTWLAGLYREREMWVPAYMKHLFWAGMKTTQRSESINSFFDGYVQKNTRLCDFVEKYCCAMEARANSEREADANTSRYVRHKVSKFNVEAVFQRVYTDAKFKEVQNECLKILYVQWRKNEEIEENVFEHTFTDRLWVVCKTSREEVPLDKKREYKVKVDMNSNEACCECKLLECHGIMCRHLILLYDTLNVKEIPQRYILRRWRKDVIRKHTMVKVAYHDPTKTEEVKSYDKMNVLFDPISLKAAYYGETEHVVETLQLLDERIEQRYAKRMGGDTVEMHQTPSSVGNNQLVGTFTPGSAQSNATQPSFNVKDPPRRPKKGSRSTRFISSVEKALKQKRSVKTKKTTTNQTARKQSKKGKGANVVPEVQFDLNETPPQ